jgi:hypothetical protein
MAETNFDRRVGQVSTILGTHGNFRVIAFDAEGRPCDWSTLAKSEDRPKADPFSAVLPEGLNVPAGGHLMIEEEPEDGYAPLEVLQEVWEARFS